LVPQLHCLIYYFLPLRDSETNIRQPEITAKMSTALKNSLIAGSITFTIDVADIPEAWNYFNTQTNKFYYLPHPYKGIVRFIQYVKG